MAVTRRVNTAQEVDRGEKRLLKKHLSAPPVVVPTGASRAPDNGREVIAEHIFGNIVARYVRPARSTRCELILVPLKRRDAAVEPREFIEGRPEITGLPQKFKPIAATRPGSLVQVKLQQDDTGFGFASGATLVESRTMEGLVYSGQTVSKEGSTTTVESVLTDVAGRFRCVHQLRHSEGESGLRVATIFHNDSDGELSLELLSSFALDGLTPFAADHGAGRLKIHRFRSSWSQEGRLESRTVEDLNLERSWAGFDISGERYGQIGTMPVRRWFPVTAVEDATAGVVWAAGLAWSGSWQHELVRRGDRLSLSGGLADREFGHWVKRLAPGESFETPEALLTVRCGSLDEACQALTSLQNAAADLAPAIERELPVAFNEWCTSWGSPSHSNILATAQRLQGSGTKYIVIDDGWALRPPEALVQNNGDWEVDLVKFPGGLKRTCDALRAMGFIPGLWFEFEVINPGAKAWHEVDHVVWRDGRPLQVGSRRFWDFTDPWVIDYLTRKVIHQLRDNGIGYLKVDYNDNLGLGCDHEDSLGEGLRLQVEGIHRFFRKLRRDIPELVIENCSSGGHRLEPAMQGLCAMGSFSDAHEPVCIPIIARNLQRLILPRQSLVWAVLHPADSRKRLVYSLAATFLGRMCLSGDIHDLAQEQTVLVREAISVYQQCAPVISEGISTFHGSPDGSYVDPKGWQVVVRQGKTETLVVAHGFDLEPRFKGSFPLPAGKWRLVNQLEDGETRIDLDNRGTINFAEGFGAGVWLLRSEG